jgi:peptide/nickel transport system ATP-binding protein
VNGDPLVEVRDLEKHYPITEGILKRQVGTVHAVDGISFTLDRGETLGLVGESGCGKSTAASALLRLEEPTGGEVLFEGEDVTEFTGDRLKRFRRQAQMIFQDPTSSFDPRMTVGESITEPLHVHGIADRTHRREVGQDLLVRIGLEPSDYDRYPHEFSGGQKQRVALARALVVNPQLVVADEPVSALDVSIQSEILSLMSDLQKEFGIALLFISHDLSIVREVCDRVAVMYLGEIVEIGPTEELFADPQHPYTEALLSAIPEPDPGSDREVIRLSGTVPAASNPPDGCRFHTRCHRVIQPEELDLEQDTWRGVLDMRERVATGEVDVEAASELYAQLNDRDPESLSQSEVEEALRTEFDLPDGLGDPSAESAVADALDALAAEDFETATAVLQEAFTTPCEEHTPELQPAESEHRVACHLRHPPDGVEVDVDEAPAEETAIGNDR